MKKIFYLRFLQVGLVLTFLFPAITAADTGKSYYHRSADRLFWFMVISDIHIGDSGSQDTQYLTWAVNDAYNTILPEFIVAAGDLTDATNGGGYPGQTIL